MAKVTGPLFSFSASGKLANALVAFTWKGIQVFRQYVVPSNPNTPAQDAQRTRMTNVVAAWRNYYTAAEARTAWNLAALVLADVMSGFNAFTRNAVKLVVTVPAGSFSNGCVAFAGNTARWTMLNIDDGTAGDEAGNFEIWVGVKANSLLLNGVAAIAAGVITSADLGDLNDIKYVQLRKNSYARSGISKITLIA